MLNNEIPMDALMALVEERRRRYTDEARRSGLRRLLARARRVRPPAPRGERTADEHDLCA